MERLPLRQYRIDVGRILLELLGEIDSIRCRQTEH